MRLSTLLMIAGALLWALVACSNAQNTATPPPTNAVPTATTLLATPFELQETPTRCMAFNTSAGTVSIYTYPARNEPQTTLSPRDSLPVITRTTYDWYVVAPASSGRAWVAGDDVTLFGPCANIPLPSPVPTPTPICPTSPRSRLILRERGRVLALDPRPVNIRSSPGTSYSVIGQIPVNGVFFVLDGPVCENDFTWYFIRYATLEGWIAEGDLTSYYVVPYLLG